MEPSAPIPLFSLCRAMDDAARRTQNDNFGLWFGHQFAPQSLGLLGYLATSSPNLGQALRNMVEYFPVYQQSSLLRLCEAQGICRLEYRLQDAAIASRRQDAELSLTQFCNVMRLALGPASLQRRLKEEKECFKQLIESIRRELAHTYLQEERLSISELSFRLGYTEVSTFSRGFTRWHGMSPRQWRDLQRGLA